MKRQDVPQTPAQGSSLALQNAKGPQALPATGMRRDRSHAAPRRWPRILLFVVLVPLLLCLAYYVVGSVTFPDSAQVAELKGVVHMHGARDALWRPARINQLMRAKDWIRTAQGSSAHVRFFDVSTADLEENTEITIEQLGQRRQRRAGDLGVKMWAGEMAVRAVRLVDASSFVRVDTPTASTVVRGARFSVQVGEEGETQIDVHAGSADVTVGDELVSLGMGERITTDAGGGYHKERVFEPNAQLVVDRIRAAWAAPGETFRLELLEDEVNQFLAATSGQPGSNMRDAQMWFVDGEARFAATLLEPAELDLSASIEMRAVDGTLDPQVRLHTAGFVLPLPDALLIQAIESSLGPLRSQLAQAEAYVAFSDVSVEEGRMVVIGRKRPPG